MSHFCGSLSANPTPDKKAAPENSGTACKTYLSGMWKLLDQTLFLELFIHGRLCLLQILKRS